MTAGADAAADEHKEANGGGRRGIHTQLQSVQTTIATRFDPAYYIKQLFVHAIYLLHLQDTLSIRSWNYIELSTSMS